MKIMHVRHELILSTSKMAEGAKQDVNCWKETFIFSDYSFTRKELSPIWIKIGKILKLFNTLWAVSTRQSIYGMQRMI